ncbi:S8 family serine peptidase [Fibrella sp. HMF5335]|uniref:S8 family serine peptidase n=1 Tax=Fibrella rubiginis TaxID=2817060 RepID=A0A939K6D3_9BACT|nr:S8 family serine peptidase [Fibrella rubiginis]MBO0938723.1 S8 family serine peptidase [Fibrella rubiginis]
MAKNNWLIICLLLIGVWSAESAWAQRPGLYLLRFRDKTGTPFRTDQPERFLSARAISRRQRQGIAITERDLPVNPAYVRGLQQAGANVVYTSRWLNAALVEVATTRLAPLLALPYVAGLETNRVLNNVRIGAEAGTQQTTSKFGQTDAIPAYGPAAAQLTALGVDQMHAQGFRGEGMLVAILDAGFLKADKVPFLQSLFTDKRIISTYDFADREADVYDDDSHGLNVLSIMAADVPNQLYGPAYKASYVLLRTEVAASENPVEEAYWLLGAEYADSTGADVINSSLGYTTFDNPADNHTVADLTGTKTLVSRAATWAAETGMVVVNSAGNEGGSIWNYIAAPADSPAILSIGAIDQAGALARFSSIGPTADGRIKPDLVALGVSTVLGVPNGAITRGNGTSFSSPLVAGLATGFWQAFPRLTASQVRDLLRQSGSQADRPDNQFGYGIPSFTKAAQIMTGQLAFSVYPNPFTSADRLQIQWQEVSNNTPVDIRLTDLSGRVLTQQRFGPGQSLSLSSHPLNLQAGLYLLTLSAGNQQRTIRVLKQ